MSGMMIGEKHTERDFGIRILDVEIEVPKAKIKTIDVPEMDGSLDLTESLSGGIHYYNRILQTSHYLKDTRIEKWHGVYSQIAGYCQGKRMKVILDSDPGYYYIGRISCEIIKEDPIWSSYKISCDAEPYKYELQSSLEPWLWDPFHFETGVIREYKDIPVNGTMTLVVPGTPKKVIPVILCSQEMTVLFENVLYQLTAGKNTLHDVYLKDGNNVLVFTGNGTISLDYRGGLI